MSLFKIASSKNGKAQVQKIQEGKFINFVSNGKDLGESNYIAGRARALAEGKKAAKEYGSGNAEAGAKSAMSGAKGKGVSNQSLKNREVFQKKKSSTYTINHNERAAGKWGGGKKVGPLEADRLKSFNAAKAIRGAKAKPASSPISKDLKNFTQRAKMAFNAGKNNESNLTSAKSTINSIKQDLADGMTKGRDTVKTVARNTTKMGLEGIKNLATSGLRKLK